jgi:hypothetical protein
MGGYAFRSRGATGVHDPLYARCLVLDDGRKRAAIVAADLIGLDQDLVARVRGEIAAAIGTETAYVMLHCTHTHGGPLTQSFRAMGEQDGPYMDVLARKLVGVAAQAAETLVPSVVTYGEATVQIGVNRRKSVGRATEIGVNYGGPVAPTVQALCVSGLNGTTHTLLFTHACHPVTMRGDNLRITADWPGAAVAHLKSRIAKEGRDSGIAPGAIPICLQGCCGDINPLRKGDWDAVAQNGATIAEAAHTARWNAHFRLTDAIEARETVLSIPAQPLPSAEACREEMARWKAQFAEDEAAGADMGRLLFDRAHLEWCEEALAHGETGDPLPLRLQMLSLGGVRLLGISAESFVRYQLDFSAQCSGPVMTLGYTNGCVNYLPTAAEYPRGGYEVDGAHRYYGLRMYAPECEALVRAAAYDLLEVEEPDLTPYS